MLSASVPSLRLTVFKFYLMSYIFRNFEIINPSILQDILKFGAVFTVVFCAFMVGLHNLYWYYPKDVRKHVELVENNVTTEAEKHFGM